MAEGMHYLAKIFYVHKWRACRFLQRGKGASTRDYISPYLFIMVMEALSKFLERAVGERKIRLHLQCDNPRITHLLFADDLLVFSDGSRHSLSEISSVMAEFKEVSGLGMNPTKSEFFLVGMKI